jgi:putative acetyltransferase
MIRFDLKPPTATLDNPNTSRLTFVELRPWQPDDREAAAAIIAGVLTEYGLGWEPEGADRDVVEVEACYGDRGGEFWVIEAEGAIVGTGAFYPIDRNPEACEIRKMYLDRAVRGRGLGRFLLQWLEQRAIARGWREAWIETASVLVEAVRLYEAAGYQPSTGVETARCDRVYCKSLTPEQITPHFQIDDKSGLNTYS